MSSAVGSSGSLNDLEYKYWGQDGADENSDVAWMLETDVFSAASIAYPSVLVDTDSSGEIRPFILSGSTPITGWSITEGNLPEEMTFDNATGVITYTTGAETSNGSFTVVAESPAGTSEGFVVSWAIQASQGASEFLNTLSKYPFMRVSVGNSSDSQFLLKSSFFGKTTSTVNGTIIEDANYPIYTATNGDGTWNYLVQVQGYSYWMLYVNSNTDPSELQDGYTTDLETSSLSYSLVAPNSSNVTVGSVVYPSDRSDIHWGSGLKYIDFGVDTSLDGFMTSASSWSFGFRLQEDWKPDGMGRGMFTREGRNWLAVAYGHSGTYSEMMFGNGASRTYDSQETTSLPANGFPSGSYVRVTFDGSTTSFYVDGVKYYDYTTSFYWDGVSANYLPLQFSNSVSANINTLDSYEHTKWQGLIDRLWISNGVVESSDDDGSTYPVGVTHAWALDESLGSTFNPEIGTVIGAGINGN
ncbi:conserved hypothetical protein [Vibrio phage 464E53-1]|nr:conserved hypothetical protein [Vibrio phage 464E53-1]CAH9015212.1 conserved hypothetical protein [Vibrio phage 177E37-1]